MTAERSGETSGQDTAPAILRLEQIMANFPPQEKPFPITVKGVKGIIEAIVSINNEGTIVYVEPGSAKLVSNTETGGV